MAALRPRRDRLRLLVLGLVLWTVTAALLAIHPGAADMAPSSFTSRVGILLTGLLAAQSAVAQSTSVAVETGPQASASAPSATTGSVGTATVSGQQTTYSVQFTPSASIDQSANLLPNVDDPQAVSAQDVCPGYKASNVQRTASGFNASLTLDGEACNVYGTDVRNLVLTVDYQTTSRLAVNIKPAYISDQNRTQFILPAELVDLPEAGGADSVGNADLQFTWSNDPSFAFAVVRQSTGEELFSTAGTKLVYEDQFIEFVTNLPENYNLYGLGEHFYDLRLGNNFTATMFAVDNGNPIGPNLYGTHPFYLDTRYYEVDNTTGEHTLLTGSASHTAEYVSRSHGVYLRNAHPQEPVLNTTDLTWRTLGGSIDLYFFSGPDQPSVTSQYLAAVGMPAMQQYWTFGFHQCRWGYKNWTMLDDVVNNFRDYDIPLETIWTDIDYMFQYRDFENDQNTFAYAEGQDFLARLHANNQHYIPIVDSAIYIPNPNNASDNYSIYTDGHDRDVFMKNPDGSEYIGSVWPGYTVFPDWLNSNSTPWWVDSMAGWYKNVPWDAIWIDMSEVSSFCIGSCGSANLTLNPIHPPFSLPGEPGAIIYDYPEGFNISNATEAAAVTSASLADPANAQTATATVASSSTTTSYLRTTVTPGVRQVEYPPYVIKNVLGELGTHAVSPNATHVDGTQEYDIHNVFGHRILNATYEAVLNAKPGKRPLVIGRSTFAGSGKFAGHWGGDNNAKFYSMAFSIPQGLSMSLFGIPLYGPDICGFSGNTDLELCARWMELGAIYPFMRNHNVLSALSQEPYVWEDVATATRTALSIRYQLLPYMYTLFYHAHTTGATVLRALAWEFPNDPTLAAADQQLLLGPALLATPVLEPNVRTVRGVFPGSGKGTIWYDWYTGAPVSASAGENKTLDAPLTHLNLHVRGGYILPMQEARMTTAESRNSSWSLLVALDRDGAAKGDLYRDDGESLVQESTLFVELAARNGTLFASLRGEFQDTNTLANVTVLGVGSAPSNGVRLNGESVQFAFNETTGKLSVTGLQNCTSAGAWSGEWSLTWS